MKIDFFRKTSSESYPKLEQLLDEVPGQDYDFIKLINNKSLLDSVNKKADALRKKYKSLAVVGMGGSILGAKMLISAYYDKVDREIVFFDSFEDAQKIKTIDSDTHWLFISKSGETVEVLTMLKLVEKHLLGRGMQLSDHCTVITAGSENTLYKWAIDCGVQIVDIPSGISGRFSVLSAVGMLPCAFSGLQISKIHSEAMVGLSDKKIIVRLVSEALQSFKMSEWILVFWIYSGKFLNFGYWLSQLWSESLGKAVTRKGLEAPRVSTPMVLDGVKEQHAMLQQIIEGSRDKFIWLIRPSAGALGIENLDRVLHAQYESVYKVLEENKISHLRLGGNLPLGRLVVVMQLVIVVMGRFLDIDIFSQPGVERVKQKVREKIF